MNSTTRIGLILLLLIACGGQEEEEGSKKTSPPSWANTPYGSVEEVKSYFDAIEPFVREISAIQSEVDSQAGSSGKGTGANLGPVASAAEPRLRQLLEDLELVQPPPLLAPFHRDTKKLMLLRLGGCAAIVKGWQLEVAGSEGFQRHYDEATARFADANSLIGRLNLQKRSINESILEVLAATDQAAAG